MVEPMSIKSVGESAPMIADPVHEKMSDKSEVISCGTLSHKLLDTVKATEYQDTIKKTFLKDYLRKYLPPDESVPRGKTSYEDFLLALYFWKNSTNPMPPFEPVSDLDKKLAGLVELLNKDRANQVKEFKNLIAQLGIDKSLDCYPLERIFPTFAEIKNNATGDGSSEKAAHFVEFSKAPLAYQILETVFHCALETCDGIRKKLEDEIMDYEQQTVDKKDITYNYYLKGLMFFVNKWNSYLNAAIALRDALTAAEDIYNQAITDEHGPHPKANRIIIWKELVTIFYKRVYSGAECSLLKYFGKVVEDVRFRLLGSKVSLQNVHAFLMQEDMQSIGLVWRTFVDMMLNKDNCCIVLDPLFLSQGILESRMKSIAKVMKKASKAKGPLMNFDCYMTPDNAAKHTPPEIAEVMHVYAICLESWFSPFSALSIKKKIIDQAIEYLEKAGIKDEKLQKELVVLQTELKAIGEAELKEKEYSKMINEYCNNYKKNLQKDAESSQRGSRGPQRTSANAQPSTTSRQQIIVDQLLRVT